MTSDRIARIELATKRASEEAIRARSKWPPFHSTHEDYAVILEELDEAWDEIKKNNTGEACREMIQVAAMAISFVAELSPSVE